MSSRRPSRSRGNKPEGRPSPIALDVVDDHSSQDSTISVHLDLDVLEVLAPPDQQAADVAGDVVLPIKDFARVGRPTKARRMQLPKGLLIRRGECLGALECGSEDCLLVEVHQPSLACSRGSSYAARRRCRSEGGSGGDRTALVLLRLRSDAIASGDGHSDSGATGTPQVPGTVLQMGRHEPEDRPWWRRPEGMPAWMQRRADAAQTRELTRGRIRFLRFFLLFLPCCGLVAIAFGFWVAGFICLMNPFTTVPFWPKNLRKAVFGGLIRGTD